MRDREESGGRRNSHRSNTHSYDHHRAHYHHNENDRKSEQQEQEQHEQQYERRPYKSFDKRHDDKSSDYDDDDDDDEREDDWNKNRRHHNHHSSSRQSYQPQNNRNNYHAIQPSSSVVLKGLGPQVTEDDIRNTIFRNYNLTAIGIKVIRDRMTGASRGFGFLDFDSVETSKNLIQMTNGGMFIGDDFVTIEYSMGARKQQQVPLSTTTTDEQESSSSSSVLSSKEESLNDRLSENSKKTMMTTYNDWICSHCKAHNFAYRSKCFQCSQVKSDDAEIVPMSDKVSESGETSSTLNHQSDHHSSTLKPVEEIIVRGLAPHTTEDTLVSVFSSLATVKTCRVIRDKATLQSRQFAFVEFESVEDASLVLQAIRKDHPFLIDECAINATFAKRQHISDDATAAAKNNDSTLIAEWQSYYNYSSQKSNDPLSQVVDMPGYTYDSATGYYYNQQTNFYYDPKTTYFFDVTNQCWMYFDQEKQAYQVVGGSGESQQEHKPIIGPSLPQTEEKTTSSADLQQQLLLSQQQSMAEHLSKPVVSIGRRKRDKQDKSIAQWNKQSKELKEHDVLAEFQKSIADTVIPSSSSLSDQCVAVVPESSTTTAITSQVSQSSTSTSALASSSDKGVVIGKGFVPNEQYKKALHQVEQREKEKEFQRFQKDMETLLGEVTKKKKQQVTSGQKRKASELTSNDRSSIVEAAPLPESNIGNKLLKKFGWNEGEGLGKNKTGITAPIGPVISTGTGLGFASTSSHTHTTTLEQFSQHAQQLTRMERLPGETYQDVCRKRARARYESISGNNSQPSNPPPP